MDQVLRGAVAAGVERMGDDEASRRARELSGALDDVPELNARARRLLAAIKDQGTESASASEEKKEVLKATSTAR